MPTASPAIPGITLRSTSSRDSTATGIWYLTDIFINLADKVRTTGSALYRDKYVKSQGQWRIAESVYERRVRGGRALR